MPNGPINDVAQVFEEPQVKARGVRVELEHPVAGKLPTVASPMRFSGTPLEHKLRAAARSASTPRKSCASASARAPRRSRRCVPRA